MPNQMIALQARGPQLPDLSRQTAQMANMMNMVRQSEAAQRQAQQAQQAMDIGKAQEARAVELHSPQLAEAGAKATAADIKTAMDFNNYVRTALSNADSPEQVTAFAQRIANQPQFKGEIFQGALSDAIASMPTDPAQFGQWKETTYLGTLQADKRYEQEYIKQTTGTEERIVGLSKYGRGMATEVPGSRIQVAPGMTYVRGDDGSIYPMPSKSGGGFATPAPSAGAPGKGSPVANALKTNPGALKDGPFAQSQPGYTGKSGGFATFDTPAAGIAAQENLLRRSYINKGVNTINKIVNKYAPQGPENSAASVSGYKEYIRQRTGVDINAPVSDAQIPAIAKAMREFETDKKVGGRGPAGAPVAVIKGSGVKDAKSTEAERRFGTIAKNMIDSIKEATAELTTSPTSAAPGTSEYIASQIPFYGDEARKFAQSGPRQRFEAALMALLDGVTYVSTGAGVTKAQEISYKNTYIPSYQDTPLSRKAKLQRAVRFISNLKNAAGNKWTPDMDVALDGLKATVAKIDFGGGAAKRSTPTKSSDGWGSAKQVGN